MGESSKNCSNRIYWGVPLLSPGETRLSKAHEKRIFGSFSFRQVNAGHLGKDSDELRTYDVQYKKI